MLTDSGHRSGSAAPSPLASGTRPLRIAGLASHRGTNLRHIDAACKTEGVKADLALLISNNSGSSILAYAWKNSIPSVHLSTKTHPDSADLDIAICKVLLSYDIDLVFLSGYMKRVGPVTVERFKGRILNIHPSLLPAYGGQGMYGDSVYEAVLLNRECETGATVHLADEEYDHGPTVRQLVVPVKETDDVEKLKNRVRQAERQLCLSTIREFADGSLMLPRCRR